MPCSMNVPVLRIPGIPSIPEEGESNSSKEKISNPHGFAIQTQTVVGFEIVHVNENEHCKGHDDRVDGSRVGYPHGGVDDKKHGQNHEDGKHQIRNPLLVKLEILLLLFGGFAGCNIHVPKKGCGDVHEDGIVISKPEGGQHASIKEQSELTHVVEEGC